jgi:two-component system LytT family sensor kinase
VVDLQQKLSFSKWEIPFQAILHLTVFFIFAIDANREHGEPPKIEQFEVVFFINYTMAAAFINYKLLPQFLYQRKFWQFFSLLVLLIIGAILIEELILERIYFPDYRGKRFGKIIYTLADVLPIIIILSGLKLAWDIMRKQLQMEELKASVEESELRFLKSQLNPHFLFNNLNNLYSYALENSPKTPQIILEMSDVLRYMLYECKNEFVPLIKETAQLENVIRLYEMQIEGRGKVRFDISGMPTNHLQIAPLILMVFVENAFKHSAKQAENIDINILITLNQKELYFECTNGLEAGDSGNSTESGIGLVNVKKRLEFLYPNAHTLTIEQVDCQYRVRLSMSLSTIS